MNNIELNYILYYADFLSLKCTDTPVTDNCKYFFIHGAPKNAAYIVGCEPVYDKNNPYFIQSVQEYELLKESDGEAGAQSFIDDISMLRACGAVDAYKMLQCIHQYSPKRERKQAFKHYENWLNNQTYTHTILDERGDEYQRECTRYVYHAEKFLKRSGLYKGIKSNS